ncbi:hypothetical protein AWH48_18285 [Domibacillus aminovorans]|uniref:DUF4145 domain-containing protein n=1 Tax=Domibacillus aminovorans TaxID=29332 RepID=A0A177KZ83_9BACI|nr:hypothetical protein [Domibacillus aminovorans]OAH58325.1 hypothetical protein AWH48_18285 [Domibacillus aminovorans]
MKSILIQVPFKNIKCRLNHSTNSDVYPYLWEINIPILPAFSLGYFSVQTGALSNVSNDEGRMEGNKIIIAAEYQLMRHVDSLLIALHYHGIKDYSLLFPWVKNNSLRKRLGNFYEEAEKNFEQGAWLSFALLCGAVFEGMLHAKLNPPENGRTFEDMTSDAFAKGILNKTQHDIMKKVRKSRNLVHPNMINIPYVTRRDAMDIRVTLDKLIKDFSGLK